MASSSPDLDFGLDYTLAPAAAAGGTPRAGGERDDAARGYSGLTRK
jgi:hypothetical protein